MRHKVEADPQLFQDIIDGFCTQYTVISDLSERYEVGDALVIDEYEPARLPGNMVGPLRATGRSTTAVITHVQKVGNYTVLSFRLTCKETLEKLRADRREMVRLYSTRNEQGQPLLPHLDAEPLPELANRLLTRKWVLQQQGAWLVTPRGQLAITCHFSDADLT